MTRRETLGTCLDTPGEVHALWIGISTAWRQFHCVVGLIVALGLFCAIMVIV